MQPDEWHSSIKCHLPCQNADTPSIWMDTHPLEVTHALPADWAVSNPLTSNLSQQQLYSKRLLLGLNRTKHGVKTISNLAKRRLTNTIHHWRIIVLYPLDATQAAHTTMAVWCIKHWAKLGLRGTVPSSTCHAVSIAVSTLFEGQWESSGAPLTSLGLSKKMTGPCRVWINICLSESCV